MLSTLLPLSLLFAMTHGHGGVQKPPVRPTGAAFKEHCGEQPFNNQKADPYGNIQALMQIAKNQKDVQPDCDFSFCGGKRFEDNADNVQTYQPKQQVHFDVKIQAPHYGTANVSVLEVATRAQIGQDLIFFKDYASQHTGVAPNNTAFDVTMPESLDNKCRDPNQCVLQWTWDSREVDQTYINCVDFIMPA